MTDNLPETGTTSGVTPPEAGSNQQAQTGSSETLESLRAELEKERKARKEANSESAARRKRLDELERAEAERTEASKTEAQKLADQLKKLQDERDAAEKRAKATLLRAEVTAAAARLQFRDPGDVLKLIDTERVEIGDDGSVKGLDEQLQVLAKSKPYLLATSVPGMQPAMPAHGQSQGETDDQRRARMFGGGESKIGLSGGVVWPPK